MYDISVNRNIEWKAFWLHDPVFKKQPVIQPVDAKRSKYLRTEFITGIHYSAKNSMLKIFQLKVRNCMFMQMTAIRRM